MEPARIHKDLMTVAATQEFVAKIVIAKILANRTQCAVKTMANVSLLVIILRNKDSLVACALKNGKEKSAPLRYVFQSLFRKQCFIMINLPIISFILTSKALKIYTNSILCVV